MLDPFLVLASGLFALQAASVGLAYFKCRTRLFLPHTHDGVSLVRPVCGLESHIEETLSSSFKQTHKNYEVIFCVANEDDPVLPLLHNLISRYPCIEARVLIGETRLSQNPKLNNMAKGWSVARHNLIVFADSNLLLETDYCSRIESAFTNVSVAIVSSPPVGDHAEGFWGEVECAMLNTHAARWQFAASAAGLNFAQGKTLAFRKDAFDGDLMLALASEPAEDAAATKLVLANGRELNVLAPPFTHPVGRRSAHAFWGRHVRWARLRRATFPMIFALEAFCGLFPVLVLLALSSLLSLGQLLIATILVVAVWYGVEFALARALGWRANRWFLPACLVRDAMLPVFYIAAWRSGSFEWRGNKMNS